MGQGRKGNRLGCGRRVILIRSPCGKRGREEQERGLSVLQGVHPMITFRPAYEDDLIQAFEIFYENEVRGETSPPPLPDSRSTALAHILRTGTVYVAEDNSRLLAFAAAITRDQVTYLTDLFVRPDQQSSGLGQALLHSVLSSSQDGVHCTQSSTDPRALALYIRSGMRPQWPNFCLRLEKHVLGEQWPTDLKVVEAHPDDPALVAGDAQVSGRHRHRITSTGSTSSRQCRSGFSKMG